MENRLTMKKEMIDFEYLCRLGFKPHQSRDIIRMAKVKMVQDGCPIYNNPKVRVVPRNIVSDIIGIPLNEEE